MPQVTEEGVPVRADSSRSDRRRGRVAATVIFGVLALWLISPMFTSMYVEAYVARLQSIAMLNHNGLITLDDQAYPINTELLYVTRLGMVWLIQGLMTAFHSTSLWVLRFITICSFLLLVGSAAVFVRRWTGLRPWLVVVSAILTPGILEPSFFFADNIVAAALTVLALALIASEFRAIRWLMIGVVLASAMLVRLDAALAVPMVLAVLWLAGYRYSDALRAVAYGALGACAVFLTSYLVTGVSLVQSLQIGRFFSIVNNNTDIYQTGLAKTQALIFFGFFGLLTLPLIAIGAWVNLKTHRIRWNLVMLLMPLVFYAAVIPHANEIRDFCIMGAPFVLIQASTGLQCLLRSLEQPVGRRKPLAFALLCGYGLVLFAPPYLSMRDGPRAIVGRIYSPIFWRQWQGRTAQLIEQIQGLVHDVKPRERVLIVNSQFEGDRYLHLRLLQDGFRPATAGGDINCRSIETFQHDDRTIVSIRTENPYGMVRGKRAGDYLEALQIQQSLHCLAGQHFDRSYFFSIGESGKIYWPGLSGPEIRIPQHFPIPILHSASYGYFSSARLSAADINRLSLDADEIVGEAGRVNPGILLDYPTFQKSVAHRFWFPNERRSGVVSDPGHP